jgi:hypothetical protein
MFTINIQDSLPPIAFSHHTPAINVLPESPTLIFENVTCALGNCVIISAGFPLLSEHGSLAVPGLVAFTG